MNYAFVRRYNQAYDPFLVRYFREAGIEFDDDATYKEMAPRCIFAETMKNKSPPEDLFCAYVDLWREHPDARPTYLELFEKMIGGDGYPDIKRLRELESQLTTGQGKLVFSSKEAAKDIAGFYRKFLKEPLRIALDDGAVGKELLKFFSRKEVRALPDIRSVGVERFEAEVNRTAGDVLSWLGTITGQKVESDIHLVLDEHEKMGEHMKLSPYNPHVNGRLWSCSHESELIQLSCYKNEGGNKQNLFMRPARGFDMSDYVLELGWHYVAFPEYHVGSWD